MRFFVVLFAVILLSSFAVAHPGKTDRRGGHRCLKECAEWELYYGEYHLHDKEGKAIRVSQKKRKRTNPAADAPVSVVNPKESAVQVMPAETPHVIPLVAPAAERCQSSSLIWSLLMLLMTWLLVRLRRSKIENKS